MDSRTSDSGSKVSPFVNVINLARNRILTLVDTPTTKKKLTGLPYIHRGQGEGEYNLVRATDVCSNSSSSALASTRLFLGKVIARLPCSGPRRDPTR